ncbi:NAD-dependent epimerase/dehydratase family protein, partial [bacterium]
EHTSPLFASIRDVVRFIKGSISDADTVATALEGQEAVVHLAAETGTGQSMYEITRYVDVNVGGTAVLLQRIANHPTTVRKVVVASSRAVYGEGKYIDSEGNEVYPRTRSAEDLRAGLFEPRCEKTGAPLSAQATDERSRLDPSSVYGITKLNQEQMVLTVCGAIGIGAAALRYQNVYGPGQSLRNPYTGILSIFSTRILNGKPINVFEDGRESRDFVYIDDVIEATHRALFRPTSSGHAIGIGSGVATDVLTVARSLVALYGREVPIEVTGAFRVGDIRHNYADLALARRLLEFSPSVSFEQGLATFAEWVKRQEVSEDGYDRSISEMAAKGLFRQ